MKTKFTFIKLSFLLSFIITIFYSSSLFGLSVTGTYSSGDIPLNYLSYSSTCNGPATPLVIALPAGNWLVTSVDVTYNITAASGAYKSEQRSKIYCSTTSSGEASYSSGTGTGGIQAYSRTGLSIANGTHSGNLTFEIHAYRTWGSTGTCNTTYQKVNNGTWTVTVNYVAPPTCPSPTALLETSIAATSVSLNWTSTATAWSIEYGPTGFTEGTGTYVSGITSKPYSLTGLNSGTGYDWYVRSVCSSTDSSTTTLSSFSTSTLPITLPYIQNFESGSTPSNWTFIDGAQSGLTLDANGSNNSNYGMFMQGGASSWGSTPSTVTAAFNYTDHVAKAEVSVNGVGANSIILEFDKRLYYSFNANYTWFRVLINGTDYAKSLAGDSVWKGSTATADSWERLQFDLSAYVGTTFTISFQGSMKYNYMYYQNGDIVSIDNLKIFDPPANDAGMISIDGGYCAGSSTVYADIKNFGTSNLVSDSIKWSVNGISQPTYYWTGNLVSNSTDKVGIGTYNFVDGVSYNIIAFATSPNGVADQDNTNDTTTENGLQTSLNGTFTINSAVPNVGTNFNSFADAIAALSNQGVCGPVTFNVANGTYNEQIEIPEIVGASSTNTITFQSASGDSTTVTLQYSATSSASSHTVFLNGADWITFNQMTIKALGTSYARVFYILNGANNNSFTNNIIEGNSTYNSTSNYVALIYNYNTIDTNNLIHNNILNYGSYGVYNYGTNTSTYEASNTITNNTFNNQYYAGIFAYYQDGAIFNNNSISTSRGYSSYRGIYTYYYKNASEIIGNSIIVENTGCYVGIYVGRYNYYTPYTDSLTVANNTVSINATTGSNYAIYHNYSRNVKYYYNSVNIVGSDVTNYAMYLSGSYPVIVKNNILRNDASGYAIYSATTNTYLTNDYNNLLSNGTYLGYIGGYRADLTAWQTGSGEAANSVSIEPGFNSYSDLHTTSIPMNDKATPVNGIITDKDGNARSTTTPDVGAYEYTPPLNDLAIIEMISPMGPTVGIGIKIPIKFKVANYGFNNQTSLPFLWSQDGGTTLNYDTIIMTVNSLDTAIVELSDSMYFTSFGVYGVGVVANLSNDENRNNDTLGGDLMACGTMSGTYTIGGSGADLVDFSQAVLALNSCGVSGPVVFNVAAGIYNEQIELVEITGASATNTITFQSATNDASSVSLEYSNNITSSTYNYIIDFKGVDHVIFKHITIANNTTGSYRRVLNIRNGADSIEVSNCYIYNTSNNTTSDYQALVYSINSKDHGNKFINNTFENGSYGFYLQGSSYTTGNNEEGLIIENNVFTNQYYRALYLRYQKSPNIDANTITTNRTYTSWRGIETYYCDKNVRITNNTISKTTNGGYGIYAYRNNYNTHTDTALIANNFISLYTNGSTNYGIYNYSSKEQNYYNNSINIYGSGTNSRAFYLYSGSANVKFKNNIFSNQANGYAFYTNTNPNTTSFTFDYNNYWTSGTNFCYYSGNKTSITTWRTTTGEDVNSTTLDPNFTSSTDLHSLSQPMDNLGIPLFGVTDDIDGDTRSLTTPDIGADEYTFYPNDVLVSNVFGPMDMYCGNTSDTIRVTVENVGSIDQDSIPVNAIITTPTGTTNLVDTIFPILTAGSSVDFIVGTVNTTTAGNYSAKAFTALAADGNAANDTMVYDFETYSFVANFPYEEDFTTWPPANWDMNGGTFNWMQYGGNAAKANFYSQTSGNYCMMHTPPVDLSGTSNPLLQFSYSFNLYPGSVDTLEIQVKTCGNSWTTIWKKWGSDLQSNDGAGNTTPGSYIDVEVDIPTAYIGQNVMIRFVGISDYGADLFINNVLIAEPPVVNLPYDTASCPGGSITLDAGAGMNYSYYWRTKSDPIALATTQLLTVTTPDTIIVSVTDNNTGLVANDTVIFKNNPIPVAAAALSAIPVYNFPATLNGSATGGIGTYKYAWEPSAMINGDTSTQNVITLGINTFQYFTVTVSDSTGATACSDTAMVYVRYSGGPISANPTFSNDTVCKTTNDTLYANSSNGGPTHTWTWTSNPAGFTSTNENPIVNPTQDTWYIVEATDGANTDKDSVFVATWDLPTIMASDNDTMCFGDSVQISLTFTGEAPYSFNVFDGTNSFSDNSATNSFTAYADNSSTTNYVLTSVTDNNGCNISGNLDSIEVFVNPLPTPTYSGLAAAYCVDASDALLTPNPTGGTFTGTAVTGNYFSPSTAGAGSYNIVYTYTDANTCTNTATNPTVVNALPTPQLSGLASAYCVDAVNAPLTGLPTGGTFTGTGLVGSSFSPATAGTGSHTIYYTYTDANTCTNVDSSMSQVNALPIIALTTLSDVCFDAQSFIPAGGTPIGGAWTGAGVSNSYFNAATAGAGTFMLTYTFTDANTCTNMDSTNQTVHALPVLNVIGLDTDYCLNDAEDTLIASPLGGTFLGNGLTGNIFNPTTAGTGFTSLIYYYTDANTCFNSIQLQTTVHGMPTVTLQSDTTICAVTNTVLDAGIFATYLWSTGATTQTITVDSTGLGIGSFNYSVFITDMNTCGATDSVSVTYEATPISQLTDSLTICGEDETLFLDAGYTSGNSYLWSNGKTWSSVTIDTSDVGNTMGYMYVAISSPAGCVENDSAYVYFREVPMPNIGNDTTICWTQNIVFDAGAGYTSYLWDNGATTQTISLDSLVFTMGSNDYSVEVYNAVNCNNSDTITLVIDPCTGLPTQELSNEEIRIYPNPNKGQFQIDISGLENEEYELGIYNSLGSQVFSDKVSYNGQSTQSWKIDLSTYSKGVYYVRLQSSGKIKVKRIIIQ